MAGKKRREKPETGAAEAATDEGAGMRSQLGRQMLMLPLLWMSGKVEWTEPRLHLLRTGFVSVMILGSLLVQWTMIIVARKKDTARLKEPGPGQYIDQAKAADGSVSIEEYDLAKLKEVRGEGSGRVRAERGSGTGECPESMHLMSRAPPCHGMIRRLTMQLTIHRNRALVCSTYLRVPFPGCPPLRPLIDSAAASLVVTLLAHPPGSHAAHHVRRAHLWDPLQVGHCPAASNHLGHDAAPALGLQGARHPSARPEASSPVGSGGGK